MSQIRRLHRLNRRLRRRRHMLLLRHLLAMEVVSTVLEIDDVMRLDRLAMSHGTTREAYLVDVVLAGLQALEDAAKPPPTPRFGHGVQ